MQKIFLWTLVVSLASGCSGRYTVTAPDQLGPAGGEVVAVVRLERSEFSVVDQPVRGGAVRLRVADGPERGTFTDDIGYAAAPVPLPAEPGRYRMSIDHMDSREGIDVAAQVPVYVWDPKRPVVAVDFDCLPDYHAGAFKPAVAAMTTIARRANILYLTRDPVSMHESIHDWLEQAGYPDGPILLWQRHRWHIVRGKWRIPRVVVESRLVSQLPLVRKTFGGLTVGLCTSDVAARAFTGAGLRCVQIGADAGHRAWADLAEKGL